MNDITGFFKFLIRSFGWWLLVLLIFVPFIDFFVLLLAVLILLDTDRKSYVEEQVGYWAWNGKCPTCGKNRDREYWVVKYGDHCYE